MIAFALVLTVYSFGIVSSNTIAISYYNDCDGKDSANYTLLYETNFNCDGDVGPVVEQNYLIVTQSNGQKGVMGMVALANSRLPMGAYVRVDRLALITSGSLQGKFVYITATYLVPGYLKRCSSILGMSYIKAKSTELLINDKLDMNALISPTGAYEAFKKSCTTICNGSRYYV